MSCNFCKHINRVGMSQYCPKVGGKEIIYDQSLDCSHYSPKDEKSSPSSAGSASNIMWSLHDQWEKEEFEAREAGREHQEHEVRFWRARLRGALWKAFGKDSEQNSQDEESE